MRVAQIWALLLSAAYELASAGFAEVFEDHLRKLPYTCAFPMEEGERIEDTTIGEILFSTGLNTVEQLPTTLKTAGRSWCERTIPPDPPPHVNRTLYVETCAKALSNATEYILFDRLLECDEQRVAELCRQTRSGHFCLVSRDNGRTCALTTFNQSVRKPFEVRCIMGFNCPGGGQSARVCNKGLYCPEGASAQLLCRPGHTCIIASQEVPCDGNLDPLLHGSRCEPFGIGRMLLPDICRSRSYCEGGSVNLCPDGHFCPEGTATPLPCTDLEECSTASFFPDRLRGTLQLGAWWLMQLILLMLVFSMDLCGRLWALQVLFLLACLGVFLYSEWGTSHGIFIAACSWHMLWTAALCPALHSFCRCWRCIVWFLNMAASVAPLVGLWFFYDQPSGVGLLAILWPAFLLCASILGSHGGVVFQTTVVITALVALIAFDIFFFEIVSASKVLITSLTIFLLPQAPMRLLESLVAMRRLSPADTGSSTNINTKVPEIIQREQARRATLDLSASALDLGTSALTLRKALSAFSVAGEPMVEMSSKSPRGRDSVRTGQGFRGSALSALSGFMPTISEKAPVVPVVAGQSFQVVASEKFLNAPKTGNLLQVPEKAQSSASRSPAVCLALEDVSFLLRNGKVILNPMSLAIAPACTAAVLGPSGSGKSSLTNVLSGRGGDGIICGTIKVNGLSNIDVRDLRSITAFVPQEDMMHRDLTCLENVAFQAKLRLPPHKREFAGLKWAEREAIELLENIGLGPVQDQRIGDEKTRGISGGQRKRVSIAMELISKPSLLFLDEPTTGLDSTTAHGVVEMVTRYAHEQSCTTLAVLHQPRFETLQMFDHIILLATGGYLVYSGPVSSAVQYFIDELGVAFPDEANPADVLMDATTVDAARVMARNGGIDLHENLLQDNDVFGQYLQEQWEDCARRYILEDIADSIVGLPDLNPKGSSGRTAGEEALAQFRRAALQMGRAFRHHLLMNAAMATGVTIISYCIFAQRFTLNLFFEVSITFLFLMLAAGVSAQRTFGGAERFVAWRESGVSINMIHYFASRDMASLVEVGIMASTFTTIYWYLGPLFVSFSTLFWNSFAFIYCVYGYGFLWSIFMESSQAQMMSIMTSFAFFFVCGMQPPFASIVKVGNGELIYLMALSPIRWAQGFLIWEHVVAGKDAQFRNPLILLEQEYLLDSYGVALGTNFTCDGSDNIRDRWLGEAWGKPVSLNCSNAQLYLLGLILRVGGACSLVALSKIQSTGGGALFQGRGHSVCGEIFVPLLNLCFWTFLIVLLNCELNFMLNTH